MVSVGGDQVPALFVVDDWNALYWPTMYFESPTRTNQRNVLPIELRLAVAVSGLPEPHQRCIAPQP